MSSIRDILLRITANAKLQTKGSLLDNIEGDNNFILFFECLDSVLSSSLIEAFDATKTYPLGYVTQQDSINYTSLQAANQGHTPGVGGSEAYWQESTLMEVLQFISWNESFADLNLSDENIYDVGSKTLMIPVSMYPIMKFKLTADVYSGATSYDENNVVQDGDGVLWVSLINGNIGEALDPDASPQAWARLDEPEDNVGRCLIEWITDLSLRHFTDMEVIGDIQVKFVATDMATAAGNQIISDFNTSIVLAGNGFIRLDVIGGINRKIGGALLN